MPELETIPAPSDPLHQGALAFEALLHARHRGNSFVAYCGLVLERSQQARVRLDSYS